MIVITGATGNVGSKIADQLLSEGKEIRVIGRSAEKLQPFKDRGANVQVGDIGDTEFLTRAFKGADVVFSMIPPNPQAENIRIHINIMGESITNAIRNAGVKKVIQLSSQGAELEDGTGPVLGLHDQEQRLNALEGVDVLHLRPTYFMENLLWNMDLIKSLSASLKGMAMEAIIRSGDYPRGRGSINVTVVLSELINSRKVMDYFSKTINYISVAKSRQGRIDYEHLGIGEAFKDIPSLL